MTIVLVHGNPETEAIWDDLVPHLRSDEVVRLSPPGFGSAIPSGFDCTADAYRDWLAGELGKLAPPIDLVGHDWAAGTSLDRYGAFRSDTILDQRYSGMLRRGYVWHDMAQAWQTPEIGEQAVARMLSLPAEARAHGTRAWA